MSKDQASEEPGWLRRKAKKVGDDVFLVDRQTEIIGQIRRDVRLIANIKNNRRVESFDDAMKRLGLTENDIQVRYGNLCMASRIMYAGGGGAMLFMLYAGWQGSIFQFVSSICIASVCFVSGAANAFRAWQIERRELGGFETWLQSPGDWAK